MVTTGGALNVKPDGHGGRHGTVIIVRRANGTIYDDDVRNKFSGHGSGAATRQDGPGRFFSVVPPERNRADRLLVTSTACLVNDREAFTGLAAIYVQRPRP